MPGRLTAQEIRGGVWRGMSAEQLPIKVILLPLAKLAQAGVGVLIKRAARCREKQNTLSVLMQLHDFLSLKTLNGLGYELPT